MRARRTALLLTLALCAMPLRANDGRSLDVPRSEGEFVRVIIRYRGLPPDARRGGAPATSAFQSATAPGTLDLRISFADAAGNTTEWIGESVFTNGQAKTRAVRR